MLRVSHARHIWNGTGFVHQDVEEQFLGTALNGYGIICFL